MSRAKTHRALRHRALGTLQSTFDELVVASSVGGVLWLLVGPVLGLFSFALALLALMGRRRLAGDRYSHLRAARSRAIRPRLLRRPR